jgi:hypothetical protein
VTPEPNRKRHAIKAPRGRWLLLGELLQARRQELGYKYRPAFARERLQPTDEGNPNVRLVADAEMGYRDTFPPGTLREIARAYEVAYDSVTAVLDGRADALAPAVPAAPAAPVTRLPPMTDAARIASARPYADAINRRLRELAGQGLPDPGGVQVFGPGPDAKTWDGIGARLDIDDRVWFIADLQRRADGRDGSGSGAGQPEVTPR